MTFRPDCRTPGACAAKGAGLCRPCSGALMQARLLADPARVAARLAKSLAARDTAEHRAHLSARMRRQQRNPAFRAKMKEAGRRTIAAQNADPAIRARAKEGMKRGKARTLATRLGIPVFLVPEFRELRRHKIPVAEVLQSLRDTHPHAFAILDADAVRAARRVAGPLPAPGTESRRAWIRTVTEAAL